MLFGCSGFVFTSLVGYFLTVWPFFVFPDNYRLESLLVCITTGFAPSLVLGLIAVRKFGLPGGCGFVAASMATAIFLYLRIQQMFLAADARQSVPPDYPRLWMWVLPLAWIILAVAITILFLPKNEFIEGG